MALGDLVFPTTTINVGDSSFTVRGLTFADVTRMIDAHRQDLETLVNRGMALSTGSQTSFEQWLPLIQTMPDLAAKIIACASDEPEAVEAARRLPLPVQLDALIAIGNLTFAQPGGLGKFIADLLSLVRSGTQAMTAA